MALPYISGVSSAVFNRANELASRGHEISIFYPRPEREDRLAQIAGLDPGIKLFGLPFSVPIPNAPKLRFSVFSFYLSSIEHRCHRI